MIHPLRTQNTDEGRAAVEAEIVALPIADLRDADSPRTAGVDPDHVRTIAEVDDPLPPILVHRDTMCVIDGMHRLAAASIRGLTEIEARFFHGSLDDAFQLGVRMNIIHGLPLTAPDRRAAAERIIRSHPQLSDRSIARTTGLATRTVAAIRSLVADIADSHVRVGKDGRVRPLSAAEGRLAASRIIALRPDASLRQIAQEARISVGTARDVRLRVLAGEDPVPTPRRQAKGVLTGAGDPVDVGKALESLRRDPSLRYSESGRALLRWLDARIVTMGQWRVASHDIPAHVRTTVEKIARECARVWTELADEIGRSAV